VLEISIRAHLDDGAFHESDQRLGGSISLRQWVAYMPSCALRLGVHVVKIALTKLISILSCLSRSAQSR
jgi:hypothetical protein